jgi:hypothetical protein
VKFIADNRERWGVEPICRVLQFPPATYPRPLFDLTMGLDRWCYRVLDYSALMTDQYPPFRLDCGGTESTAAVQVSAGPAGGGHAARPESGGDIRPRAGLAAPGDLGSLAWSSRFGSMHLRLRPGPGGPLRGNTVSACAPTSDWTGRSDRGSPPPGTTVTTGLGGLPAVRQGWRRLALGLPNEPQDPTAVIISPALLLGMEFGIDGEAGAAPS